MLFAAKPWTYWMALPLLVGSLLALVGWASVYLRKVVEPNLRRLDALAAAGASLAVPVGRSAALPASPREQGAGTVAATGAASLR